MLEAKRWDSIDFIKGLACIAVVLIHFNFPGNIGLAVRAAGAFGVPVFFFVSGFFLGWTPQTVMDANKLVKKIKHIFTIVIWAMVFYAFFTVFWRWINGQAGGLKEYAFSLMTATNVTKFFIQNNPFLYSHLWFLFALIYCYLFILFVPIRKKWLVGALGLLLMVGYLLMTIYHPWTKVYRFIHIPESDSVISIFQLFPFRALGFFLMGMYCKESVALIEKIRIKEKILVLFILGGSCLAAYEGIIFDKWQFYNGTYIMLAALFIWAIQNPQKGRGLIGYIGRELSLYIYILHVAVGKIINLIYERTSLNSILDKIFGGGQNVYAYTSAFIILGMSILVAWSINKSWCMIKRFLKKVNRLCVVKQ